MKSRPCIHVPFNFLILSEYTAANLIASVMLTELAFPVPAISWAVPWSTDVLRKGNPQVIDTVRSKSTILVAICPWSW